MKSKVRIGVWALLASLLLTMAAGAEEPPSDVTEIALEQFEAPDRDSRGEVEGWIIDLETSVVLADRIGVVATGEYFQASGGARSQRVGVQRFAFFWAFDHAADRSRVIYGNEELLEPVVTDASGQRYARASGSKYDQLKIRDLFYESLGRQRRPESKQSKLEHLLKMGGLFYPVTASTATVTEMKRGTAHDPRKARIDLERLTGVYRQGGKTFAEFVYQYQRQIQVHRIVVFRDGLPIQVSDFVAMSSNAKPFHELKPGARSEEDEQRLKEVRKRLSPQARTLTQWSRVHKLDLPTSLKSMTLRGGVAMEIDARFVWLVNKEISDRLFSIQTVGELGPMAAME